VSAAPLGWGLVAATSVLTGGALCRSVGAHRLRARVRSRIDAGSPAKAAPGAAPAVLTRLLHDAAVPIDARRVLTFAPVVVVGSVIVGTLLGGPAVGTVAATTTVLGPLGVLWACRHRRSVLADRALPAHLDAVARALRGGASLRLAVIDAAGSVRGSALGDRAELLAHRLTAGSPFEQAVAEFGRGSPLRALVAQALGLASAVGGAPAAVVDGVADTVRERAELAAEARALAAQAQASAVVVALAPVGFSVLAAATDPRVGGFLSTPVGVSCLLAGLLLDAAGAWWMHRQIRGVA